MNGKLKTMVKRKLRFITFTRIFDAVPLEPITAEVKMQSWPLEAAGLPARDILNLFIGTLSFDV